MRVRDTSLATVDRPRPLRPRSRAAFAAPQRRRVLSLAAAAQRPRDGRPCFLQRSGWRPLSLRDNACSRRQTRASLPSSCSPRGPPRPRRPARRLRRPFSPRRSLLRASSDTARTIPASPARRVHRHCCGPLQHLCSRRARLQHPCSRRGCLQHPLPCSRRGPPSSLSARSARRRWPHPARTRRPYRLA
ncbi:Hypothetical protein CAP_3149 [Chondromyces apiculatus DSM 436]|uniref:Uncharacterized protein n=1 Tax=Chondromyces apiculatus DSM 436 TaxID=1192034 RepID=A0A017TAI4_9BACT|nr:Hypothetical protein CAP_3149 [Chondromyces apiculatus DSM 436]